MSSDFRWQRSSTSARGATRPTIANHSFIAFWIEKYPTMAKRNSSAGNSARRNQRLIEVDLTEEAFNRETKVDPWNHPVDESASVRSDAYASVVLLHSSYKPRLGLAAPTPEKKTKPATVVGPY